MTAITKTWVAEPATKRINRQLSPLDNVIIRLSSIATDDQIISVPFKDSIKVSARLLIKLSRFTHLCQVAVLLAVHKHGRDMRKWASKYFLFVWALRSRENQFKSFTFKKCWIRVSRYSGLIFSPFPIFFFTSKT